MKIDELPNCPSTKVKEVWCVKCSKIIDIPNESEADEIYCPVCGNWDSLIEMGDKLAGI